jgi:hypothetical protein
MAKGRGRKDVGVDVAVAGGASWLGLLHPGLVVPSAAAAPVASATIKRGLDWVAGRRRQSEEYVFGFAANAAGLQAEELKRRCEQDAGLEDLLRLVLGAAADTADREKLIVYSLALASGASMPADEDHWQSTLVRTIRDLGAEHLVLLDRFTWSMNRLSLAGGGAEFDSVPSALNDGQVEMVASDIPALPSVLATLQGHGLLVHEFATVALFDGGGSPIGTWKLTDFGSQVLDLLRQLGSGLHASTEPPV